MGKAIPQPWVKRITQIVEEAGAEILKVYETDFEIQTKSDESPLTQADLAAHQVIVAGLHSLTPEIPIISEESAPPSLPSDRSGSVIGSWTLWMAPRNSSIAMANLP